MVQTQRPFATPYLLIGIKQDGPVEVLLVAEIVVEQPFIGPRQGGNGVHPRALEAAFGKFGPAGDQDRRLGAA
ncbi:hypothetical protein D3C72_2561600 [compost metagenome]